MLGYLPNNQDREVFIIIVKKYKAKIVIDIIYLTFLSLPIAVFWG